MPHDPPVISANEILDHIKDIRPDFNEKKFGRYLTRTVNKNKHLTPSTARRTALKLCLTAVERGDPLPWEGSKQPALYTNMTVAQLNTILKIEGLPLKGKKADKIERLLAHRLKENDTRIVGVDKATGEDSTTGLTVRDLDIRLKRRGLKQTGNKAAKIKRLQTGGSRAWMRDERLSAKTQDEFDEAHKGRFPDPPNVVEAIMDQAAKRIEKGQLKIQDLTVEFEGHVGKLATLHPDMTLEKFDTLMKESCETIPTPIIHELYNKFWRDPPSPEEPEPSVPIEYLDPK